MLRIEGERIYLRDHRAQDLADYHAWLSDPVVTRFLTRRASTLEESFIELAGALRENDREPRTRYYLAVVRKAHQRILGEAGFTVERRDETGGIADLGYFLLPPYWGHGYATEAARAMIAHCFTQLKLHKVTAGCDAENLASERVMKKCGMEREALQRRHRRVNGEWRDRLDYALLYEDWLKRRSSS